jgi:hypothetical protein
MSTGISFTDWKQALNYHQKHIGDNAEYIQAARTWKRTVPTMS